MGITSLSQANVVTPPGLVLVASAALSGSSVIIEDCFSSSYETYLITVVGSASVEAEFRYRLRVGGTTESGAVHDFQNLAATSTTVAGTRYTGATSGHLGYFATVASGIEAKFFQPFAAARTVAWSNNTWTSGGWRIDQYANTQTQSTSYTSINFFPSTGTFSTGTVRVYGYRNNV